MISRQTAVSNEFTGWFGREIEDLAIIGTYNLLYNATLMVKENLGYALCLDKLVNTSGNSELCFRPLNPKLEAGLNIIWKNIKYSQVQQVSFWSSCALILKLSIHKKPRCDLCKAVFFNKCRGSICNVKWSVGQKQSSRLLRYLRYTECLLRRYPLLS